MTENEWLAATDPEPMLEWLEGRKRGGPVTPGGPEPGRWRCPGGRGAQASDRKYRLFASACRRRVGGWLREPASWRAVEVAERLADGAGTAGELRAASDDAAEVTDLPSGEDPDRCPPVGSWYAARAACCADLPWDGALYTAWAAGAAAATGGTRWDDPGWEKVLFAAWVRYHAEFADQWDDFFWEAPFELYWDDFVMFPGWVAERAAQARLLRDVFGNPFRPAPDPDPAWLAWGGGVVRELAQAGYEERRMPEGTLEPARLAVLADALEAAGCADAELLGHLRGPGPHVRGCWAVDLLLERE